MDAGETLMARWLDRRALTYEFEPDWGVQTKPDFRVSSADEQVAIEVESIESWGGLDAVVKALEERIARDPASANRPPPGGGFKRSMDKALRPLRTQIRHAARQLKPLAGSGIPLVVAVANPYDRPVPFSVDMMISAMYGDPGYEFPSDGGPGRMVLGRNGKLWNDHPYVSAVMVIRQALGAHEAAGLWFEENRPRFGSAPEMPKEARRLSAAGYFGDEQEVAVDLVETKSDAARVPAWLVGGPGDTHWVPNDDGSGTTRVL
jgi:hypothetical protein